MKIEKPNFFMVGAPKCGTTFMYNALRQHHEIYMPEQKELHFFAPDLYPPGYITQAQYQDVFRKADREKVIGEASVWYLYSDKAPELISSYDPDAKILIMLRNPVDMLRSLHRQQVFDNMETIEDFGEALKIEPARKEGEYISPNIYSPKMLFYSELGKYYCHVDKYLAKFGKDRVHIILYDDLSSSPENAFSRLLQFLNVSTDVAVKLGRDNASKAPRFRIISKAINPGGRVKSLLRPVVPFKLRRKVIESLVKLNSKLIRPEPVNERLRDYLKTVFVEDVENLGELIGRDLSSWVE